MTETRRWGISKRKKIEKLLGTEERRKAWAKAEERRKALERDAEKGYLARRFAPGKDTNEAATTADTSNKN